VGVLEETLTARHEPSHDDAVPGRELGQLLSLTVSRGGGPSAALGTGVLRWVGAPSFFRYTARAMASRNVSQLAPLSFALTLAACQAPPAAAPC